MYAKVYLKDYNGKGSFKICNKIGAIEVYEKKDEVMVKIQTDQSIFVFTSQEFKNIAIETINDYTNNSVNSLIITDNLVVKGMDYNFTKI